MKAIVRSKYAEGGMLAAVGYLLSPLSFWNDLFINFPIAYVFAFGFGLIHESLFAPVMILVYWATNIAGFILIQKGIIRLKGDTHTYGRRELLRDTLFTTVYTLGIVLLIHLDIISFPSEWLER